MNLAKFVLILFPRGKCVSDPPTLRRYGYLNWNIEMRAGKGATFYPYRWGLQQHCTFIAGVQIMGKNYKLPGINKRCVKRCILHIPPSCSSAHRWFLGTTHQASRGRTSYRNAWTLVELLILIAIVATFAGIAIPSYKNYVDKTKNAKAMVDIRAMEQEIIDHRIEHGTLPSTLAQAGLTNHLNPWKNPYCYLKIQGVPRNEIKGKWRKERFLVPINSDYDLYSMGKDGKSRPPLTARHSWDDIVRANDGGYVGLASEY